MLVSCVYEVRRARSRIRGALQDTRHEVQDTRYTMPPMTLLYNVGTTSPYYKLVDFGRACAPVRCAPRYWGDWMMMISWLRGFSLALVSKKDNSTSHRHCTENRIYAFPEKELRGLSLNSYTFMCLWALYIFPGSVHIFGCGKLGRLIQEIYKLSQSEGIRRLNIIILLRK